MIKRVGSTPILAKHRASCHCYLCAICGIYTHHQRRSNPAQYGYNVGCLEGVNPFDIPGVPTHDGLNRPADR